MMLMHAAGVTACAWGAKVGVPGTKHVVAPSKSSRRPDLPKDHRFFHTGIKAADCHKSFIKCINKHLYDGGEGFSESCPYSEVVPVMEGVTKLTLQLIEKWNVKDDL